MSACQVTHFHNPCFSSLNPPNICETARGGSGSCYIVQCLRVRSMDFSVAQPTMESKSSLQTRVVRLKRANGKVVQGCDVYIGRRMSMGGWDLPESKWANPFTVKQYGTAEVAVAKYKEWFKTQPHLLLAINELRGKILGCWCKAKGTEVCHGDYLAELANAKVSSEEIDTAKSMNPKQSVCSPQDPLH